VLGRRRLPSELQEPFEAFRQVVADLEPAKAGLTRVLPTTRLPGAPLADALNAYEAALARAAVAMPRWRHPAVEDVWVASVAGVATARERARRLREDAPDLGGFEGLIGAIEHLLDPLEPIEAADATFRDLRAPRKHR
jgi:hypothetical protein